MQIVDLRSDDESAIRQVAALLVEGFATNWPGSWSAVESGLGEVRESFAAGRISRVAFDEDGTVLGWIGGISQYRGHVWELHPLVVRVSQQGQGIGRALVADLEERVKERGGVTIPLRTDTVTTQTSFPAPILLPPTCHHLP